MTDTDRASSITAIASLGVTVDEVANRLIEAFGNVAETVDTMLDGTPIVDAEPISFQRNGIWYKADGTPIGAGL